jgi:hypothetical protein
LDDSSDVTAGVTAEATSGEAVGDPRDKTGTVVGGPNQYSPAGVVAGVAGSASTIIGVGVGAFAGGSVAGVETTDADTASARSYSPP